MYAQISDVIAGSATLISEAWFGCFRGIFLLCPCQLRCCSAFSEMVPVVCSMSICTSPVDCLTVVVVRNRSRPRSSLQIHECASYCSSGTSVREVSLRAIQLIHVDTELLAQSVLLLLWKTLLHVLEADGVHLPYAAVLHEIVGFAKAWNSVSRSPNHLRGL